MLIDVNGQWTKTCMRVIPSAYLHTRMHVPHTYTSTSALSESSRLHFQIRSFFVFWQNWRRYPNLAKVEKKLLPHFPNHRHKQWHKRKEWHACLMCLSHICPNAQPLTLPARGEELSHGEKYLVKRRDWFLGLIILGWWDFTTAWNFTSQFFRWRCIR